MSGSVGAAALVEIGRGRAETLADGVFAIVSTLLVLEIKVPQAADGHSLARWPLIVDYPRCRLAVSFYGLVVLLALGFVLLLRMARAPGLIQEQVDRSFLRRGTRFSVLMGPVADALGAGDCRALRFSAVATSITSGSPSAARKVSENDGNLAAVVLRFDSRRI